MAYYSCTTVSWLSYTLGKFKLSTVPQYSWEQVLHNYYKYGKNFEGIRKKYEIFMLIIHRYESRHYFFSREFGKAQVLQFWTAKVGPVCRLRSPPPPHRFTPEGRSYSRPTEILLTISFWSIPWKTSKKGLGSQKNDSAYEKAFSHNSILEIIEKKKIF